MRTKGLLVVVLILLLTSCTMVAARNKGSTHEAAATPTAVSRPTSQSPSGGDDVPPLSTQKLGHEVAPPPAILDIAGQEQVSGIGTYCWTKPSGGVTAVSLCVDTVGISTAEEPLTTGSPFTATFRLSPREMPDELTLEVIPVTTEDEIREWTAGWRGWPFRPGQCYSLLLERESSVELSLEPGLYVLPLRSRPFLTS